MPLFSDHISNMYYSGSPSYTSPSYGYKSSYNPLGTSYSASYLSPGGSYSNHSSISSYSRAPLTSHRWIPGLSRSYSPMLTPISERGTASPIRINSPRRIPIAKRCYGSPSYIQRPININTESIDVSKDRYRSKPEEVPSPPSKVSLPKPQNDEPVKHNENSPFMPRVDGKPETGIDSSPGLQRSTIKRGRTVVRLHTIKRKDKDSPRKPLDVSQSQEKEIKDLDALKSLENEAVSAVASESLSWREKLSDDLIYVEKKEKKSLGTKLVEKFTVTEKDNKINKSDTKNSEEFLKIETLSEKPTVASTSKSPDRRYSMELLAEQSSLFDSLIRGENLSTATLDLSKVGIADESKNKLVSSDSIKRRKIDDKGNPLKTTKSDHSLHETLNNSLKGNKDSKVFTKRRSLKKSQSGGSIHRLDSITELPKESVHVDLPAIEENRFSPKQIKTEQKAKPRTKITATVEVSPPTSPLKFRIENVIVEEKHHKPKKEISFSYDVEESPVQEVTVQGPKTTLKRCKERNSIKKKTKKVIDADPPSPEPDDGNFWAKIGKRETVYLIHRKQNIEAAREEDKKLNFWFNEEEEEESKDIGDISVTNKSIEKKNVFTNQPDSNLLLDSNKTNDPASENVVEMKKGILKNVSTKLEKSKSSDNMKMKNLNTHNSSLRENKTKPLAELKHAGHVEVDNKNSQNKICVKNMSPNAEIKNNTEICKTRDNIDFNLSSTESDAEKARISNEEKTDLNSRVEKCEEKCGQVSAPNIKSDETPYKHTDLGKHLLESKEKSSPDISSPLESLTQAHTAPVSTTLILNTETEIVTKNYEENVSPIAEKMESLKTNNNVALCEEKVTEIETIPLVTASITKIKANIDKSVKENSNFLPDNNQIVDVNKATVDSPVTKIDIKPINKMSTVQSLVKSEDKDNVLVKASELCSTVNDSTINLDLNISVETKPTAVEATIIKTQSQCIDKVSIPLPEKVKTTEPIINDESKVVVPLSIVTKITESKEKVNSVSSLQTQAKRKVESKQSESLTKRKQKEADENIKSNDNKSINSESKKKNVPRTESTEVNSKKKVKKIQTKVLEKNKDIKTENVSSSNSPKENICSTCKKSLSSGSLASNTKLIVTKTAQPLVIKQLQEKDKVIKTNAKADKPIDNVELVKLDSSAPNSSNSKTPLETSASTSQIPLVIETKDIPNNTESGTNQVKTSEISQEKTGEENKAETNTKRDDKRKIKQSSIKEVKLKKPVKQDKPVKPLIATPRPLLKRAPQVIHSDSSDSSTEEESSEEEESDTSENSGEFYECENNPDGRTSTGSNDSGFDSSAPTSPASFLQIKKGADSPGPSSSSASAQLPASDVVDSELELEQSTAYGLFRKTGRFTPPARSIPRFRKYNIEDFQFIKVLGKGSFGKVLLAELRDTEYYYAVKCLKKDVVLEDDDVECTLIERKVLALGTNHPYLCHLFATFQTDSHLFFVMEYLNGGDLMFHIQQSGRFPEPRARFYAAEIVSGLKFLHKRGIVYRDLKLDNILLDFDGHVRIADFGMCKLQIYLDKTADTFCGTPDYMAPEIIKGLKYNQTVDWWSFGVLLYEMLIGQSPFSGCDEDELFWSICNEMPSYPRFLSKESLAILTRLLDKDARTRLGGTECMHGDIREQDFFHPVHWDKLERRELETPFKPRVRHPLDTQYFDRAFTGERPRLTAVEPHVLRSMDQEPFRGFSYTNPNATDR